MSATVHQFPGATPTEGGSAGSIRDAAMLARLHIRKPQLNAFDKAVAEEVAGQKDADIQRVSFTKRLYSKDSTTKLTAAMAAAREYHYKATLPWLDDGARLLPSAGYLAYCDKMRKLESDYWAAAETFKNNYAVERLRAQKSGELGDLYDPNLYPDPAVIEAAFLFETRFLPIPSASDFRVDLSDQDREALERDVQAATTEAMNDVWLRVAKIVKDMIDRLAAYVPPELDDKGKKVKKAEKAFKSSLVDNMREFVEILPVLNITNDEKLATIATEMREGLCVFDGEALREQDVIREHVMNKANAILDHIGEFFA